MKLKRPSYEQREKLLMIMVIINEVDRIKKLEALKLMIRKRAL